MDLRCSNLCCYKLFAEPFESQLQIWYHFPLKYFVLCLNSKDIFSHNHNTINKLRKFNIIIIPLYNREYLNINNVLSTMTFLAFVFLIPVPIEDHHCIWIPCLPESPLFWSSSWSFFLHSNGILKSTGSCFVDCSSICVSPTVSSWLDSD